MNRTNLPTLIIFSGLPGTGKSTLADRLAREVRWPLLRIDDVAGQVPPDADYHFWDEKILVLLTIVEAQLKLGLSVIAASVFMGADRMHAQEIARKYNATFRPVYCFISDETIWEKRVNERIDSSQQPGIATWKQIQHQRQWYLPWQPGTGLFVDALEPVEKNYAKVLEFVVNPTLSLEPINVEVPLAEGKYHE